MTMVDHDIAQDHEDRESGLLVREFTAELTPGDGRTVDVRVVPFGETATVADGLGGVARGIAYQEEWMPGCFDGQLNAANRIYLNFQHEPGLKGIIGKGVALRSAQDGYHGSFKVLSGDDGDKALELVREDVLTGVSVEVPARTLKSVRSSSGIIQRVKGHLDSVALCRVGAFAGARVLALRDEDTGEIVDENLVSIAPDPELLERLQKAGIELPAMYALDEIDQEVAEILKRSFVETQWDGSASRYETPEAYCAASAIDLNPSGSPKTKDACHLPFKEPSGEINVNGVRAALSRIGQGYPQEATQAQRERAKAVLTRLLGQFNSSTGN